MGSDPNSLVSGQPGGNAGLPTRLAAGEQLRLPRPRARGELILSSGKSSLFTTVTLSVIVMFETASDKAQFFFIICLGQNSKLLLLVVSGQFHPAR